jgi:hypothetical protein
MKFTGGYNFKSNDGRPDYSNIDYWAAHPYKKDPADSIPAPLRSNPIDSAVDVFFLHPTTYTTTPPTQKYNADIDDSVLNAKTDYTTILYQASVFNESCRVFAPRYRQANLSMYFHKDTAEAMSAFNLAYADIKTAFQYYLDHFNQGRPIIIASHSQGTTHAKRLLKEFFENKTLYNKLVCAYIIGIAVEKDYFSAIPLCKDSISTGCFISWRTFRTGYIEKKYIRNEKFEAAVVNPLLWTSTNEYAPPTMNKGAVLLKFNKVYPHTNDAVIHGNILWISKPRFPFGFVVKSKNYHAGDINLFYLNIRKNIKDRIGAFWKK